jgi:hypothetical protein
VVVAAAIALSAVAVGAGVLSAGAASSTTYYACLKSGTLSKVGTTAPTCTSPATQISWNQTGPQGPTGPAGAAGNTILSGTGAPTSTIGAAGNFYLETSNHTIYGPATRNCSVLPCKTVWGSGTSLVGPQGAPGTPGLGVAYDTQTQDVVNDPSGQFETVLTQTLPVSGDFEVVANVTAQNPQGNTVDWSCTLEAANPGNPAAVNLGRDSATNTGGGGAFVGNETNLSLQGVVSIAAGGTVWIVCGETGARENDLFEYAHITSTQVSGLSVVAPS